MSRDAAGNCLCGIAVSLHFDAENRMKGCKWAAQQTKPVDRGRLFKLKLQKNHEARQAALASITPTSGGFYRVRVGGAVRGKTIRVGSHALAVQAVHEWYNEAMLAFVERRAAEKS